MTFFWNANGGEDKKGPMEVYLSTQNDFEKKDETGALNKLICMVKVVD